MLRASNRPVLAYFDAIKSLRLRQLALILKTGYDPNLLVNARGQNGLQYMISYFGATDAHFRLQVPINKAAYLSIAKLLLDSGLDPNASDLLTGETAIYDAIRLNDKDMVSLLLNYVDFSLRNKNGETCVMCAARFGTKQIMRLILEHLRHLDMDGYFLRQRNRFGMSALELARAENLECAKVLTRHLIAHGNHHPSAVLARSTSHHQLRAIPYHLRPTIASTTFNPRASTTTAALLDDSGSEYDSDVLASPYHPMQARGSVSRALMSGYKTGAGFYDPKAAEFNQYLLEQQDLATVEQQQQAALTGAISDDEDYFGQGTSSGLTRSRSCMLGPNVTGASQSKQSKYPTNKSKTTSDTKQQLAGWPDANNSACNAGGSGGRNTID